MANDKPKVLFGILKIWIPLAAVLILMSGLIYVSVQQNYRQSLNDPQIQMAEDAAAALANGEQPQDLIPQSKVDMAKSLAPYLIIFDEKGQPVASSVQLDGKTPAVPAGVFDYTKNKGEDRISWEPRKGVRSAAVIVYYNGASSGFVLAGRSMREVEIREDALSQMTAIVLIISLLATLVVTIILVLIGSNYSKKIN
jgi:hypothetical protein